MQQLLNFLVEPHGHGSLRPSFSISSLQPWTMRSPRLTCVSDGNPLRRLLVRSKKGAVELVSVICHTASYVESRILNISGRLLRQCDVGSKQLLLARIFDLALDLVADGLGDAASHHRVDRRADLAVVTGAADHATIASPIDRAVDRRFSLVEPSNSTPLTISAGSPKRAHVTGFWGARV